MATLRQMRRTVPITFSIELVQASERRSFAGSPVIQGWYAALLSDAVLNWLTKSRE